MEWLASLRKRWRALVQRRRLDRDLRDELDFHLAMREAKLRSEGMDAEEAKYFARRRLGNATQWREEVRRMWTFAWIEGVAQDARFGIRTLRKSPALAIVVVLSLALGIGLNTAIFSVMDAVMLRLLPVEEPQQLISLYWVAKGPRRRAFVTDIEGRASTDAAGVITCPEFSSDMLDVFRSRSSTLAGVAAFAGNSDRVNLGLGGRATTANEQAVSGDYFATLGVNPFLGRVLLMSDDQENAAPAAVVSFQFWRSEMSGNPDAMGKPIHINGTAVTVVGVAPPEFFGLDPAQEPQIYVPLAYYRGEMKRTYPDFDLYQAHAWWISVVGRVKPGVTAAQAQAELAVVFRQGLKTLNGSSASDQQKPELHTESAAKGLNSLRDNFSTSLMILMGMVGLVLLVACINVAALLLSRATARQREIAVRLSLGAPRGRLIRQLLTESVLLSLAGAAAGLVLARWGSAALVALFNSGSQQVPLVVWLDGRVLGFAALVAVGCGIAFGLAPAIGATRVEVAPALKKTGSAASQERAHFRAGKALIGGQVALSLMLLVAAGLLLGTLGKLEDINLGFDRSNLITFTVQPGVNSYQGQALAGYYEELQRRIEGLPGVKAVGFSQLSPVGAGWSQGSAQIPGFTEPGKDVPMYRHWIGAGFFEALGQPVVLGRGISQADGPGAPYVAVINQRAAELYFHGQNPIGRTFSMNRGITGSKSPYVIVGVVRDTKYGDPRQEAPPLAYFSYVQRKTTPPDLTYQVRTSSSSAPAAAGVTEEAIEKEARALDANVPVLNMQTTSQVVDKLFFLERTFAVLSTTFALLALLLACIGLYGTIAYTVERRTSELGIRLALGAQRGRILGMVLAETLLVVAAGIVAGLPLAWIATRLLKAQLFGVSAHDPVTMIMAVAVLVGVTAVAGWLPAHRASRVDPLVALRCE